jgi:hypothetical protein
MLPRRSVFDLVCAAIPFALLTRRFGSRFLDQFFVSPFQFFIVVPFGVAAFSMWQGYVPLRSGGRIYRERDPAAFWRNVRFAFFAGGVGYFMNLWISWMVASRWR